MPTPRHSPVTRGRPYQRFNKMKVNTRNGSVCGPAYTMSSPGPHGRSGQPVPKWLRGVGSASYDTSPTRSTAGTGPFGKGARDQTGLYVGMNASGTVPVRGSADRPAPGSYDQDVAPGEKKDAALDASRPVCARRFRFPGATTGRTDLKDNATISQGPAHYFRTADKQPQHQLRPSAAVAYPEGTVRGGARSVSSAHSAFALGSARMPPDAARPDAPLVAAYSATGRQCADFLHKRPTSPTWTFSKSPRRSFGDDIKAPAPRPHTSPGRARKPPPVDPYLFLREDESRTPGGRPRTPSFGSNSARFDGTIASRPNSPGPARYKSPRLDAYLNRAPRAAMGRAAREDIVLKMSERADVPGPGRYNLGVEARMEEAEAAEAGSWDEWTADGSGASVSPSRAGNGTSTFAATASSLATFTSSCRFGPMPTQPTSPIVGFGRATRDSAALLAAPGELCEARPLSPGPAVSNIGPLTDRVRPKAPAYTLPGEGITRDSYIPVRSSDGCPHVYDGPEFLGMGTEAPLSQCPSSRKHSFAKPAAATKRGRAPEFPKAGPEAGGEDPAAAPEEAGQLMPSPGE